MDGSSIDFRLYLITDRHATQGKTLLDAVQEAIHGGVEAVQLREKDLPPQELYDWAVEFRKMTYASQVKFFINDRVDLTMAVEADGVHLRSNSFPVSVVRKLVSGKYLIGVSAHNVSEARRAAEEGADFITLGPIYETQSKKGFGNPTGPFLIREVKKFVKIPILALGGIKIDRIQEVMEMGSDGVGVISGILSTPDVCQRATEFRNAINRFLRKPSDPKKGHFLL